VLIAAARSPSALQLDASILDAYTIPSTASVNAVPVTGWRGTLESGFHSAFPGASSGRTLQLLQAELSFGAAAVGMGGTAAVRASIRFKARLLDASGKELGAVAGTADAHDANTSASEGGMTANASEAVEALYEMLTNEFISKI